MQERALILDPGGNLNGVAEFLQNEGWKIEFATAQSEALQKASVSAYALVLCRLDSMNDVGFIGNLWAEMKTPTQVLAVGPDDVRLAVGALQNGVSHYWPVPFVTGDFQQYYLSGRLRTNRSRFGYNREGTLLQVIKEIALTMELDGLANILVDSAIELADADGGAILLLDEKSNSLQVKAFRGMRESDQGSEFFGIPAAHYRDLMQNRQPVLFNTADLLTIAQDHRTIDSAIIVPTWWKDQPLGDLVIVKFAGSSVFSAEDLKLLTLLNEEIAGAVYNAITHYKTKELTIKDDLTEAYNRRYFEQYLEEEFSRARRYNSHLSLIFLDVDNLKDVNLKYGHLIGSKTLQEIAHRVILTVRGIDKVVRYGGDEFCIVLPETDAQGAYQVAERIRNIISGLPFSINENAVVTLTGSFGIACFPDHAVSKEELVRQADRAMFVIKNLSKNAIAVAQPIEP